jgi:hypothetical protein
MDILVGIGTVALGGAIFWTIGAIVRLAFGDDGQ